VAAVVCTFRFESLSDSSDLFRPSAGLQYAVAGDLAVYCLEFLRARL
jgi:hypothetical protein